MPSCRPSASSARAPRASPRRRRCTSAGSRSTASRSPTASAATGSSATRTGCRRPTARCTSTPRASGWSTPTSRCRSRIPTSRTTRHIAAYFDDYVDHFGFRDRIAFETGVEHAERERRRHLDDRARHRRDAPLRRAASSPTATTGTRAGPSRRSRAAFDGEQMHAHHYVDNEPFKGKTRARRRDRQQRDGHRRRVELRRRARRSSSSRRGAHVIPKYLFGRPLDQIGVNRCTGALPWAFRQRDPRARSTARRRARWRTTACREPDHELGDAHPTISADFLNRIAHGEIDLEAEHRRARRATASRFEDGIGRAGRRDRLVHRLQGHVPVLRRGLHLARPTTTCRCSAASSTRRSTTSSSSACCSRSARSCRWPRRRGVDRRVPARRVRAAAAGRAARRHRARARADVQALRRLQAPHDAGRLRQLPLRPRAASASAGARARARARLPPAGRRRGPQAARRPPRDRARVAGKRERTKAQNRAAILDAAREVFAEIGYDAAERPRRRCAAPASPPARSTTTSPTRSRSSARCSTSARPELRRRLRDARAGARDARGVRAATASARTSRSSSRTGRCSS